MATYKKVILVANTAWSMFNFRQGVICQLMRCGYQITIIAPSDAFSEKLQDLGCEVIDLPINAKGTNPLHDLRLVYMLYNYYNSIRPDFIIHYTIKPNIYGSLAAKIAGIPSIAITTGLGYTFVNDNMVAKIARVLYKIAFLFPNEVWFLNEDDRSIFLKKNLVAYDKAVLLHGEGIDLEYFKPQTREFYDGKIRFLLIARMLWDKGIGEFVEAARLIKDRYPNVIFQLLGECDVANPSAISRQQISLWETEGVIEYLGTASDVRKIINKVDCLVLPSYREGIPRTLMEAAAMAKPLVTTDSVGCRDVVLDRETGLLCLVKDHISLAECFEIFINMPVSQREEMGQAGRAFMAQVFDERLVIEQYLETLKKYIH
ncbi:glycosyltransferase family 4 protein [Aeromonas jandaei]|uniref:glycosyltransferase family 4 protein n=1 Tax=Aeromonas jandaei TaxID=650 RepID=UPI003B9F9676